MSSTKVELNINLYRIYALQFKTHEHIFYYNPFLPIILRMPSTFIRGWYCISTTGFKKNAHNVSQICVASKPHAYILSYAKVLLHDGPSPRSQEQHGGCVLKIETYKYDFVRFISVIKYGLSFFIFSKRTSF